MQCVRCGGGATRRDGRTRLGGQRWRCAQCQRRFTARSTSAFRPLLPRRRDRAGGAPVLPLSVELRRHLGVAGRAGLRGRPKRGLPVGAALPAPVRGGRPAAPAADREAVACRRDVLRLPRAPRLHLPRHRPGRAGGRRPLQRATQRRSRAGLLRAGDRGDRGDARTRDDRQGQMLPASLAHGAAWRGTPPLQVPEQWIGAGPLPSEAAAVPDARLQAGHLRRRVGTGPRARPQPLRRMLQPHRRRAAEPPHRYGVGVADQAI